MKYAKVSAIVICVVFLLVLAIPVLFMDWKGGRYSENEQRMLADFPISVDKETGELTTDREKITNYISDNIGFRDAFVKIGANIKYNVFRESTSEKVMLGKDGWLFYTPDNNIEIATGEYPLSNDDLAVIAENQQSISDYYKSIGVEYVLMLTPSKVSIYPEYLPMSDETVEKTPVDIVSEYLKENTDVLVYNAKDTLLEAKAEDIGQLYHKTDTHWNQLGSYCVYRGLHDLMVEKGILSDESINVEFSDGTFKGEFSKMLGDPDLLAAEPTPIANWDYSFKQISEGELYSNIDKTQDKYDKNHDAALFVNESVPEKTLQIYGDSQLMTMRKIPQYLAEHFSTVVNFRIRCVSSEVDKTADPDVVLFSVSERYINSLLTQTPDIPFEVTDVSLPEQVKPFQEHGLGGMFLTINGQKPDTQNIIPDSMLGTGEFVKLSGWAVDFFAGKPLSALYLKIGDKTLKCNYGSAMPSVSEVFKNEALTNTGFSITVPLEYFNGVEYFEFIEVGSDGSYRFQNVRYFIPQKNKVYSVDEIDLPGDIRSGQNKGHYGMWLDRVNDKKPETKGEIDRSLFSGSQTVTLYGWAVDFPAGKTLSSMYLKLGDKIIECSYGIAMVGPATTFDNQEFLNSGFLVRFPAEYLNSADVIEFIQIGSEGTYQYTPVRYQLIG